MDNHQQTSPNPSQNTYSPLLKTHFVLSRGDLEFTIVCAILGFIFVRFIIWGGLGMGAGAFVLLFVTAAVIWLKLNHISLTPAIWFWLGLLLLSAVYFMLYDNFALKLLVLLLNITAGGWLMAVAFKSRVEDKIGRFVVLDVFDSLLSTPVLHMGTLFQAVLAGTRKKNKNVLFLFIGLAASVPVLLIMGAILSSADAVFDVFWKRLLDTVWDAAIVGQIILSVPLTLYLYGVFYGNRHHRNFAKREKANAEQILAKKHVIPTSLLMGIICPVILLYITFFVTQTAYFLSAFQNLIPEGFNASEQYARRGFYELCFVSGFNLFLWIILRGFGQKIRLTAPVRAVGVALSAVSLGMVVITLRKMMLNIDIHGFTLPRVYTTAFMLLVGLIFILTVIRMFLPTFPLERTVVVLAIAMLLGLGLSDPNRWVAHYNVSTYQAGKIEYLDVPNMDKLLGSAATPALIRIVADENMRDDYRTQAAQILTERKERSVDWRRTNAADLVSQKLIEENWEIIELVGKLQKAN